MILPVRVCLPNIPPTAPWLTLMASGGTPFQIGRIDVIVDDVMLNRVV